MDSVGRIVRVVLRGCNCKSKRERRRETAPRCADCGSSAGLNIRAKHVVRGHPQGVLVSSRACKSEALGRDATEARYSGVDMRVPPVFTQ